MIDGLNVSIRLRVATILHGSLYVGPSPALSSLRRSAEGIRSQEVAFCISSEAAVVLHKGRSDA